MPTVLWEKVPNKHKFKKSFFELAKCAVFRGCWVEDVVKGEQMKRWGKIVIIAVVTALFIDLLYGRHWVEWAYLATLGHFGPDCATPSSLNKKDSLLSHIKRTEKVDSPKMVLLLLVFHLCIRSPIDQDSRLTSWWFLWFSLDLVVFNDV